MAKIPDVKAPDEMYTSDEHLHPPEDVISSFRPDPIQPLKEYKPSQAISLKSPTELKKYFLEQAQPLIEQYINAAIGSQPLASTNAVARNEVWGVLKTLMLQSSDKIDIDTTNAEAVIKAVTSGKCTLAEGQQLMDMFQKLKTINQVESGTGQTLNIIIEGAGQHQLLSSSDDAIDIEIEEID